MHSSVQYWVWLSGRPSLQTRVGRQLYENLGRSIERLYLAQEDILGYYDLSDAALDGLLDKTLTQAHAIMGQCKEENIQIVTLQDAHYPNKLRNLVDPPFVLYYRGSLPLLDEGLSLSMVGARNATPYGISLAMELSLSLTRGGVTMITGMAQGVDSAVVEGALKGGGPVVSVVAGGLDVIYPKESKGLYHDVATVGCLMSEYPPGTRHKGSHFHQRNRILSGLSNGVCVVECLATGGTMVTARLAEEQGRDLFAIPGAVASPNSRGPHLLIQKHGAYLVTSALDILAFYREKFPLTLQQGLEDRAIQVRLQEAAAHIPIHQSRSTKPPGKPKAKKNPTATKQGSKSAPVAQSGGLEFVPLDSQKSRFTDDQICVLQRIGDKSHSIDGMVELCQLPAKRLLSAVTILQMNGDLDEISAGIYKAQVRLEQG